MRVIEASSVDQALFRGLQLIKECGLKESSRAGDVTVAPFPVTTVYSRPDRRVLFNAARDANPFFHLMEALFYLAGRNDTKWLDQFVSNFSERFAEPDGRLHGSYGFRWRRHFDMEGGGSPHLPDQLETVIKLLKANPQDRQAVLTMWDPVADLGVAGLRDRPCNTHVYLRIRREPQDTVKIMHGVVPLFGLYLDITVCCRSNDLWWGAYGANAVQFSVLQEYLAARIGVRMGTYYQISNNFHAYESAINWRALELAPSVENAYDDLAVSSTLIVTDPGAFDQDLHWFFENPSSTNLGCPTNPFFREIAVPMYRANQLWKRREREQALRELARMPVGCDWRVAAEQWAARRMAGKVGKAQETGG